jgi:CheY-like chemotaxis protein
MKGTAFIVHWDTLEVKEYSQHLFEDGWSVANEAVDSRRAFDLIKQERPDVVVIYLSRHHTLGRVVAKALRSESETRDIPIVFVDGKEKIVRKAVAEIPDAIHTTQEDLLGELLRFRKRDSGGGVAPGSKVNNTGFNGGAAQADEPD